MRTKTIELYQYAELSEKAKAKARDWYREASAGDPLDTEFIFEDFINIAGFCGWTIPRRTVRVAGNKPRTYTEPAIYWSGFSCQGDGACFEGTWTASEVNAAGLKEHAPTDTVLHHIADRLAAIAKANPDATGSVKNTGHYSHKYATTFDGDIGLISEEDWIDATRDLMQWLYDSLENEYEYQQSDEAVAETIEANEYEFTIDGEPV